MKNEMGNAKHFADECMKEKLILAVQSRPCIWDLSSSEYNLKLAKVYAWSAVALECGCPQNINECKMAWKCLRQKYKREKERMSQKCRSGELFLTCGKPTYIWHFYAAMSFLDDQGRARRTSSNLVPAQSDTNAISIDLNDTSSSSPKSVEDDNDASIDDVSESKIPVSMLHFNRPYASVLENTDAFNEQSSARSEPTQKNERRKRKADHLSNEEDFGEVFTETVADSKKTNDEIDACQSFCNSIAKDMREMPKIQRLELQQEIVRLIVNKMKE